MGIPRYLRRYVNSREDCASGLAAWHGIGQSGCQMTKEFDKFAARAAPAMFVLLWSTGFIGTKYVINNADPLTYLAIRMAIVVGLMAIIVAIARYGRTVRRSATAL